MGVRLLALVPVFGLLLVGCTSSAQEPLPQPPPFSAAPTATPSAVAIEVPPSARGASPRAAAAFARYYYEEFGRAFTALDGRRLQELSTPTCVDCLAIVATLDKERAAGKRYEGGGVVVRSAEAVEEDSDTTAVAVVFDTLNTVQTAPGAPTPLPGTRGIALEVLLVRTGESWLVTEIRAGVQ